MARTRTFQRPRRYVGAWVLTLLRPLFRQSAARDAYVLRLVGERYGPVLRRRNRSPRTTVTRAG